MQSFVSSGSVKQVLIKRDKLLKCLFSLSAYFKRSSNVFQIQKKFECFWELLIDYLCCFQFQWGPKLTTSAQSSPDYQWILSLMDQLLQEHDGFFKSQCPYDCDRLAQKFSLISLILTYYLEHEDYLLIILDRKL